MKRNSSVRKQDTRKPIPDIDEDYRTEIEQQNEELRDAQSIIEESREKYSDLYDFSPICYFTFDTSGTILESNLTGAALLDTDRLLLIGKPFSAYVAQEDQSAFKRHREKVLGQISHSGPRSVYMKERCELKIVRRDGTRFHALLESIPVRDRAGRYTQMRSAVSDVTEQRELREALTKSLELLEQKVLERTAELSVRNDQLLDEIKERRKAEEALRISQRELSIRSRIADAFLRQIDPDIYPVILEIILEAIASTHGIFSYIDDMGTLVTPAVIQDGVRNQEMSSRFLVNAWKKTFWGKSLLNLKSVYRNGEIELPAGHTCIRRAMAVPVVHSEKLVGFFLIANKETDYTDEDKARLENLAAYIAPILHSKLQEETLNMKRREAEMQLAKSREQLRALAANLEEVREEERKVIAREIHDEFGQALTCLKMDLSFISRRMKPEQKELVEKASTMMRLIDFNIQLIRDVASQLRPGILDDFGLLSAVEWQLQSFALRTGIKYRIDSNLDGKEIDSKIRTALFRVFQEALTNVMRHAEATAVEIELNRGDDHVLLMRVRDNGRGISEKDVQDKKNLGLLGMRERVSLLGGYFQIDSGPGKGTKIEVRVPLE